ncbi:hypothetical protein [Levilactobacillus bambusae]|uniref:Uncharacterized protein n=1 Tax=Levilactobacillus bambusae TaxID=2024736 RepID=A0A2V1N3V7_9LACO|nr:hypothetical protein [Levilactobacillus bambusae]PWG01088.1 hypothetical protein DCM90_02630 [Levilactobacillus bambusae]
MDKAVNEPNRPAEMRMSEERAAEVVRMVNHIRQNFPEFKPFSNDDLIYETYLSFKDVDTSVDSDLQTMSRIFYNRFNTDLGHSDWTAEGFEEEMTKRFFMSLSQTLIS